MSYILEALKKAQAERQLGNAPTIHAPQPAPAAQPALAGSRRPLFVGLGAGALVVLAGVLLLWQRAPAPAAVSAAAPATLARSGGAAQPMPAPASAPASATAPATAPADVLAPSAARAAASNTLVVSAPPSPSSAPAHPAEAPAHAAAVAASGASAGRAGEAPRAVASAPVPAPASAPAPAPRAVAASPAPEDSLPFLQQLPDALQRDLPRVSFGGYMYSSNPADRLLLVDKTLRHEGEEVAPGLVLEKLLPKAAVMNYRGTRYRVAY